MPIAQVIEWIYKIFGPYGMKVPQLIPSRIRLLSCSRSFNCSKAKDRLGYAPIVPLEVFQHPVTICFSAWHDLELFGSFHKLLLRFATPSK
jgi:hypothetical protein